MMIHASERLYADASVRSERIAAHKSAYLAEERRRWSAESVKARKHSRRRAASPRREKPQCSVARTLDLEKFSDAFCDEAAARDHSCVDVDGVEPEVRHPTPRPESPPSRDRPKTETELWRDRVLTTTADFDAWVRSLFSSRALFIPCF